ncbi:MAG: hypothetical protein KZQ83_01745 [gamma proteobacterium symbiont of Taylorina sp.]|nr:hypothetical protein [gamma proteobacterium symbiont of Taylorina sp.]
MNVLFVDDSKSIRLYITQFLLSIQYSPIEACSQLVEWRNMGLANIQMSVNVAVE